MKDCPHCLKRNRNDASNCWGCGKRLDEESIKPLLQTKICPSCGEEIQDEAILCRYCKYDLTDTTPTDSLRATWNQSMSENHMSDSRPSVQEVIDKLLDLENPKKSFWKGFLYLAISILIFIGLGLLANPVIDLFILIGVLLIHETGHYVAMTIFGYRDVRMFFIPLFGAAVSGKARNVSATKKAIVYLAGPLPGIFLALIVGILGILLNSVFLGQISLTLVFINGFNLLPVIPFDGGRFFVVVVFSRNRYIEALFRFLAGGALVIGALYLQDIFIGIIGILVLITIPYLIKIGAVAQELGQEQDFSLYNGLLELPPEVIEGVIAKILKEFPRNKSPKSLAQTTSQVWDLLSTKPPKIGPTVGLISLYLLAWLFIFFGPSLVFRPLLGVILSL
jgi:Zn-dependent protease